MSRADRRLPGDFRARKVVSGISLTSQGSSRLSFGSTEVIAVVQGPRECRMREIDTGKAIVRVKTFPEMNELNDMITTTVMNALDCAAYPDSTIDINLTVVNDDGSLICCAINAVIMALTDARLRFVQDVAASAFAIRDKTVLVDPSKREEDSADGVATFVWVKTTGDVFSCFFDGIVAPEVVIALMGRVRTVPE